MIRALIAIVFAICASVCIALPARANTCTVPNSLVNGQVVDANALNTNFVALQSCGNNIDSTNVGPAGILASQIISNSAAAGTFGGTAIYTLPHGIISGMSSSAIALGTGNISGVYPTIQNSSEGGINSQSLASSTYGHRWFKYDGTTLTQLAQLDSSGNYSAAGGGLFQSTTAASTIGIGTAISSTYPTFQNSSDGGLNTTVASSSVYGHRWFKYNGTTLAQLGALDSTGSFSAANNVTAAANLYTTNGYVYSGTGNPLYLCAAASCASYFELTTSGYVTASGGQYVTPAGSTLSLCANNNCATAGAVLNTVGNFTAPNLTSTGNATIGNGVLVAAGSTPLQLCPAGACTNNVTVSAAGQLLGRSAAGAVQTYLAPIYTVTGGAVAATEHTVIGSGAITLASGAGSQTITFGGAAVFASAAYYCLATPVIGGIGSTVVGVTYAISAANAVVFYMESPSGAGTVSYSFQCTGP